MNRPPIGRHALRRGRVSDAGRLYFVTKVTRQRVAARWPAARRTWRSPRFRGTVLRQKVHAYLLRGGS